MARKFQDFKKGCYGDNSSNTVPVKDAKKIAGLTNIALKAIDQMKRLRGVGDEVWLRQSVYSSRVPVEAGAVGDAVEGGIANGMTVIGEELLKMESLVNSNDSDPNVRKAYNMAMKAYKMLTEAIKTARKIKAKS